MWLALSPGTLISAIPAPEEGAYIVSGTRIFMAQNSVKGTVVTICPYCGCGCRLRYTVIGNRITKAEPVKDDPTSKGKPCIKGLTSFEPLTVERLEYPMIRHRKNGPLCRASWKEAYQLIKEKLNGMKGTEIMFTGSGEYTNEANYIMQKLARVVFKTNNIDCCARLCHVSTSMALRDAYGLSSMPSMMDDVLDADCILAVGTNPIHNYPVLFNRILSAKNSNSRYICT